MKTSLLFLITMAFMLGWLFENTLNLRNICAPPPSTAVFQHRV